ncbi:MAG TPA: NADH-quinone oxidoreductase subunit H [Polyangiaceae bacterium]
MRAWLPLLSLWLLLLSACRSSEVPANLLTVSELGPNAVELGDRVELEGSGFPEGKPATLTFRGTLYRPGQEPLEDVEIITRASSSSRDRMSLLLDEELYSEFAGRGAHAGHTTFQGRVVVSIAPRQRAAPPISGVLENVVLDFAAPPGSSPGEGELSQGGRLLEFAGLRLHGAYAQRLVIESVAPGSRAEGSGLLPGDEIIEFEGVRTRSRADLFPSTRSRNARLSILRSGSEEAIPLALDVRGFRTSTPEELAPATALVALAAGIFLLLALPGARLLTWCERRLSSRFARLRAPGRSRPARTPLSMLRGWRSALRARVSEASPASSPVRVVPALTCLGVTALFTLLSSGHALFLPDLELMLLLVAGATVVAITGMLVGGAGARTWSLLRGLKRAALVASCQLPLFAGALSVLLATGSLRVRDVVLAQGAWPWQWHALKNPALAVTFLVFVAALVPDTAKSEGDVRELDFDVAPRAKKPALAALSLFSEWALLLLAAGVCAVLFLGGWQLPLIGVAEAEADHAYRALGAALLLVKCWGVVLIVLGLRWLLPPLNLSQVMRFCWRWCVPWSLAGVALAVGWSHALSPALVRALERGSGIAMCGILMLLSGYIARARLFGGRAPNAASGVNPWL